MLHKLKPKSTEGVFHEILRNFRTASLENNCDGATSKKKIRRGGLAVPLMVSGFCFLQGSYLQVMKQSPFSINIWNLDYVIQFYKPKKGLDSLVLTIKILVVEIFGCY